MDAFYKQLLIVAVTTIAVLAGVLAYKWIIAEMNLPKSDDFRKSNPKSTSSRHVMHRNDSNLEKHEKDMPQSTISFSVKTPMRRNVQTEGSSNESVTDSSDTIKRES